MPSAISRLLRHARFHLGRLLNFSGLAAKQSWELEWQRQWAAEFSQPAVKEKVHEYWRKYRHLDEVLAVACVTGDSRILDVGCGIASVLHFLGGARTGIDPLVDDYKRFYCYPPDISVVAASGEHLPFPSESFDFAFCSNCIDHTTSPPQVIAEIERVLVPRGYLLLTCETFEADLGVRNEAHPHTMTARSLHSLVQRFAQVKSWQSPWYGLQNYASNLPPTAQQEHILLCQKIAE